MTSRLRRRSSDEPRRRRFTAVLATAAVVVGALIPVAGAASAAQAAEVVLPATDAAWTTARQPTTVQKSNLLSATATSDRTYLKFDAGDLSGKKITSATLVVRVTSTTATQRGILAFANSTVWHSATLTAANSPKGGTELVSLTAPVARSGQNVEIPLDVDELAATVTSTGQVSLRLQYEQRYIRLALARTGANAPRIVVETTDAAVPRPTVSPTTAPTTAPKPTATPRPTATPAPTPTTTPTPKPTSSPTPLPVPPRGDGQPLVFAHYFVPYPLSIDNENPATDYYARHYLSPSGENGKFASTGGLLRDRPLSPAVSKSSDWRVANFATEVQQAKSAGIDGWTLNLMSTGGQNWDASLNIMKAADRVGGFSVVPMIDGSSGFVNASPETVASLLAQLYSHSSAYKEGGEFMLATFKAEGQSVAWWTQVISLLEGKYGLPITFLAVFNNASDGNMRAFAPIADGFGNWGTRTERTTLNSADNAARAHALGKTWMEPVAVQDVRYKSASWAEANNTASVRAQWDKAIKQKADYVQVVTWNDYSESTQIAPSQDHGDSFLDLTRYYTQWFHTGTAPRITSDEIIVTHRTQFTNAGTSSGQQKVMGAPGLDGNSTPARDAVEVVVWLTAPATVEITAGGKKTSVSAPAGISAHTVPLQLGAVSARVVRNGAATVTVSSPYQVVGTPYVQDLQYYAASSW